MTSSQQPIPTANTVSGLPDSTPADKISSLPDSTPPDKISSLPDSTPPDKISSLPDSTPPDKISSLPDSTPPDKISSLPDSTPPDKISSLPDSTPPDKISSLPDSTPPDKISSLPDSTPPDKISSLPDSTPPDKISSLPDSTLPDRISDLPDSTLCHILSFLSTKQAASTSVLSKRWKPLWLSVLTLHFDDTSFKFPVNFLSGVYSTMQQQDTTLPIHSFSFICRQHSLCKQNDINQFIEFVLERGVQNFTLHLMVPFWNLSTELPQSIVNCETLEVLKLKGIKVGYFSHLQDLHLPKLKTLHLNHIFCKCNQLLYSLLLGCPLNIPSSYVNLVFFHTTPMFQRLTHLELSFEAIGWYDRCMWLLEILKHSPKLQSLIIQDTRVMELWGDKCWEDPEIVPECLSSNLKTCCISGYEGNKWDFKFAKYIIENSKVLNTMTIHSERSFGIYDKYQMLGELSSCARGSTTCKLLFD
ncbi:putative FBD-associated F-box protein At1g50980 [Vicia villosa]|uniref:putative FBD-associated F-box protein At1g50980 n=1 Tax=Vicia villosa TaxID=3911 RepID=UPI00273CD387|nr:putative FBD-associated F-box protein At1g50980 [Vicia villosa]